MTAMLGADLAAPASRAAEATRPTRREQIGATRLLIREETLELDSERVKTGRGTRSPYEPTRTELTG